MEAALSIPDSRTSLAAAMSFLVSPTAMNGTFESKTGDPPLMARSDAVAVVIFKLLGGRAPCVWSVFVGLLIWIQGKDMRVVGIVPIILFGGFGVRKGIF